MTQTSTSILSGRTVVGTWDPQTQTVAHLRDLLNEIEGSEDYDSNCPISYNSLPSLPVPSEFARYPMWAVDFQGNALVGANEVKALSHVLINSSSNASILEEFFAGTVSGDYCDGQSHQLYLDLFTGLFRIDTEADSNNEIVREDGMLIRIAVFSGAQGDKLGDDERYNPDTCNLVDFGWTNWFDHIEAEFQRVIEAWAREALPA